MHLLHLEKELYSQLKFLRKPILKTRMANLIADYIEHLRFERNFSESTIECREKMLLLFAKFADNEQLSTLLIQNFLRQLAMGTVTGKKWGAVSIKDMLIHIKQFTRYLYFAGKINEDYAYRIPRPRLPETLPKRISASAVEKIYSQPKPTKVSRRIWKTYNLYFELLAKTGLRKTESKILCRRSFNFEEGHILVYGKGRRETYCLIPPDMSDRLEKWFDERELLPDDLVFLGRDGRVLNNDSIRFAIQKRAELAGITQRVWPHLLRHFFGTDLLLNGVDLAKVQRFMRHKRITSTQVYLDLVIDDLKPEICKHSLIKGHAEPQKTEKPLVVNIYNPNFTLKNNSFEKSLYALMEGGEDCADDSTSEVIP